MRRWAWVLATAGGALAASPAAEACELARSANVLEDIPEPWRVAMVSLLHATEDPAQPWGCPDATVSLELAAEGAILSVKRGDAEPMQRELATPDDLVPVGKALLARPVELSAAPPDEPSATADAPTPSKTAPPASVVAAVATLPPASPNYDTATGPPSAEEVRPRASVDAEAVIRYVGATDLIALGARLGGRLPIGRFSAGLWVQYADIAADLNETSVDLDFSEAVIGGGADYALWTDPVRLSVGLYVAMAVVHVEEEVQTGPDIDVRGGAVDGRIGADVGASIPLNETFRILVATAGDTTPASWGGGDRRLGPRLPPLPAYTVGAQSGIAVVLP